MTVPREITDAAEAFLPGTVLRDRDGDHWHNRTPGEWRLLHPLLYMAEDLSDILAECGPLTLIWEPKP